MLFCQFILYSSSSLTATTYEILVTSANSGIIETVADAISLHNIKKNTPNFTTLLYFFVDVSTAFVMFFFQ